MTRTSWSCCGTFATRWLTVALLLVLASLWACLPKREPVREKVEVDTSVPVGRIEGKDFTGIRYPFTISAEGTDWVIKTSYPRFLLDQGYEKEGLDASHLFVFNPETRSSLQISFEPADQYSTFSQNGIEWLTDMGASGMESELDKEFGRGKYTVTYGKTKPYTLQGVPYAAHNSTSARSGDVSREYGWVFAFAEPFQMFFLYQVNDPDRNPSDREDLEKILSSFRYAGMP